MPAWPASIPQSPEREFSESLPAAVIRAPVDGPPLTRRRYTAAPKPSSASFLMTEAEKATFDAFFGNDIRMGALAYDWREHGKAANPIAQFMIVEAPQWAYVGGCYWRLSVQVIKLP